MLYFYEEGLVIYHLFVPLAMTIISFVQLGALIFRKRRTENVMKRYDFVYAVVLKCSLSYAVQI